MSLGLSLVDDIIDVYVLDRKLEGTEQERLNLELIKEMGMKIYSNYQGNGDVEYLTIEEIAQKLLEYDHILPY